MSVESDIQDIIGPLLADLGYEFVGVEYLSNPKNRVVRVYIDREGVGITVDDCALASREISALMDVEDPVKGHYTLEVSSPGVERPLFSTDQYLQFVGEKAVVYLYAPENGRRKFTGVIAGVDDDAVLLEVEPSEGGGTEPVRLVLGNIRKAHLAPDLDALMAGK